MTLHLDHKQHPSFSWSFSKQSSQQLTNSAFKVPLSSNASHPEPTEAVRQRIMHARHIQQNRFGTSTKLNAHMTSKDVQSMDLKPDVRKLLVESSELFKLSPRSFHRIIKIARTIADLDESPEITPDHVLEAFQYRPRQ